MNYYYMNKFDVEPTLKLLSVEMAFEALYDPDFYFEGETHDFWEMVYVRGGIVGIAADDRIYELSENEVVFHRPGEFHRIWSASNSHPNLFIISFRADGDIKKLEQLVFKLSRDQKNNLDTFIECLKNISYSYNDEFSHGIRTFYTSPNPSQLAGNFFEIYLLSIISESVEITEKKHDKSSMLYKQIMKILNDHIYSDISVEEVAKLCNISVSGLKKNFKKYSGTSIHRHFIVLKIIRATELLQTDMSISDISNNLNFDNQNYFSAVFKRVIGTSPSAFRKDLQ